jgi:hypothetical protein
MSRPTQGAAGLTSALLAAMFVAAAAAPAPAQATRARYLAIQDPLTGAKESIGAMAGPAAGPLTAFEEANRLEAMNIYSALETQVDNAQAVAVTTNYVKNLRVAVEPAIQGGNFLIAKLDKDVEWYEKRFPNFSKGVYDKTDPRERKAYETYQNIKIALDSSYEYQVDVPDPKPDNPDAVRVENKVLVKARQTFKEKAKDVTDGLLHVLDRAGKDHYSLESIKVDAKYMTERLEALHEVLFGLQQMADEFSKDGPHAQLLATVTNQSDSLVFFVQVLRKDADGKYAVRPDTLYPVVLYPDLRDAQGKVVPKKDLQIEPYGPRGASQLRLPMAPGDRLVVRVATMGQVRDKVRFTPIKGKQVSLDSTTLSRGFYYLGYEVDTAQGHMLSRWYADDESYSWTLSPAWQNEESTKALELGDSGGKGLDGKPLREFKEPMKLSKDRLEWTLPDTADKVTKLEDTSAEIKGTAHFVHQLRQGITVDKKTTETDEGKGKLKVFVELW